MSCAQRQQQQQQEQQQQQREADTTFDSALAQAKSGNTSTISNNTSIILAQSPLLPSLLLAQPLQPSPALPTPPQPHLHSSQLFMLSAAVYSRVLCPHLLVPLSPLDDHGSAIVQQ